MTRWFAAPPALVFSAWTEPALLKRWYGARGWHIVECRVDLRVGGRWRFTWHGPDDERMSAGGMYQEIAAPERLVYSEEFDDHWYPGESVVVHVLTGHRGGTALTTTLRYSTRDVRDLVLSSAMERGVEEGYQRLDDMLIAVAGEE
ncbi:SRPBCC family protein [Phytoactinopolyspora alkaliphila]|uniref:SRPBCC family protein n=1 Tax=Phytoactinopolyspora alkaliphila TaxID=1783498 RepID=A0A6N9YJP6_9ACTN|nr:SRPBCC family protein [Phytoactinopolyspora alkaliphila]